MAQVLPPPPPAVGVMEHDRLNRLQFRLWQITIAAVTLVLTGWFCTMGVVPAIIALFVAKHVLVAILAVGLHHPEGQA